ncbi:MAG: DUF2167 domain-containing protein [Sphingobacteriales bacterium]|nr:DUF2167 domain-containing protein [Sphingobacteriales bacterium]
MSSALLNAQNNTDTAQLKMMIDSIEKSFTYQHGTVQLKDSVATVVLPEGYKYLDAEQAKKVLVDLWHNPASEDMTLGFIMPQSTSVLSENTYVFNVQYDKIGYVKDDDADDINYDELLAEMQKDVETENEERVKMGYPSASLVGWAAKPFYDKDKKVLHWAKEIRFSEEEANTLNYNVRILGRKGVLVLNAIAPMEQLSAVQGDIPQVVQMLEFNEGFRYSDFDSKVDDVAAWTIGGLVAGKLLAKAGFFAILLKFWKVIAIFVVGIGTKIWRTIQNKKSSTPELQSSDEVAEK